MVPAACAMRSLLALKLVGSARHRHVKSYILDEGLSKRSRSQKGMIAFLAQDAETRVFCFMDQIDATADITVTGGQVVVKFQKRAHNPLLVAAGFDKTGVAIRWLRWKRLRLVFG
jgi:hypothetical protein